MKILFKVKIKNNKTLVFYDGNKINNIFFEKNKFIFVSVNGYKDLLSLDIIYIKVYEKIKFYK